MCLAIHAIQAFGDVEDDVGPGGAEAGREVVVRLEADDRAELGERVLDGVDGLGTIPFGVNVTGGGGRDPGHPGTRRL